MKKSFKTVISFMLITLLALSFSSCSVFENMRQNALEASQTTIYATPEEAQLIAQYNEILASSIEKAASIKENVSYSAGSPKVLKDGEDAGVLNAASKQLKTFIMSAKPGSAEAFVKGAPEGATAKDIAQSLIAKIDEASVLGLEFNRNIAVENVTDGKGNNLLDEDGNTITEEKIKDNVLHLTFNYFTNELSALGEGTTNENGEAIEETTVIYAEDATIESIFGSVKDKETVIKNFEAVKDYIVVSDYEIEYRNCFVTTDMDIEEETVPFINFQKNMTVTAKAEGVGALASYGEIVVTFDLTMTTRYEFTYPAEDDDTVNTDETTAAEETTAEETTVEETTLEESVSEDTATEETTAISEETSAEETTAV